MALLGIAKYAAALGGLVLSSLSLGCGDALVDSEFRGKAVWQFSGGLERKGSGADSSLTVRLAMFWNPKGELGRDPTEFVEQMSSGMEQQIPNPFLINMFEYPGAEHIARTPDGRSRGFGIGRLLVYVDHDLNGRYSSGDSFVGTLPNRAFLYVPADLPAWATPTSSGLPAGLYPVALPQRCDASIPTGTDADNCGVKLGSSCQQDSTCGSSGVCLRETDVPWPTGYCAVADSSTTTCRPKQSAYYGVPKYGLTPKGISGYYLQSCQFDQDCGSMGIGMGNRDTGLYVCDKGLLACVPQAGGKLPVGGEVDLEPFCISGL
jgi:hypothetical protein